MHSCKREQEPLNMHYHKLSQDGSSIPLSMTKNMNHYIDYIIHFEFLPDQFKIKFYSIFPILLYIHTYTDAVFHNYSSTRFNLFMTLCWARYYCPAFHQIRDRKESQWHQIRLSNSSNY